MKLMKSAAICAVLTLGAGVPGFAQEAEVLPITLSSVTVERYETLSEDGLSGGSACCAPIVLSVPGHHFVYIRAIYDVAWTEDFDRLNVSSSDIGLTLPGDAEPRMAVGRMTNVGEFSLNGTSLTERRPRAWPEDNAQAYYNGVFLVPNTVTTGTLAFEDTTYSLDVDMAVPVTQMTDPASLVTINVLALAQVNELVTEERAGGETIAGLMRPTLGHMMQLDLALQVGQSNDIDDPTGYFFRSRDFTLVGPDNAPLHNLGVMSNGRFSNDLQYTVSWDVGELPDSRTMRMYFAGNAAPGVYKVFFHGTPVADLLIE